MNNNIIQEIYDNNNFPSTDKLFKLVIKDNPTITKKEVAEFLASLISSQLLNDQKKTKDASGHIVAFCENEVWQMDIYVLAKYYKSNKQFQFMFAIVDVFTRKAYIRKQYFKDGEACADSLESIIKEAGVPRLIMSDNDSAFTSTIFQKILNENEIILDMNVVGDHNALGIIDNFARRIKSITSKLFINNDDLNWISHIDKILKIYNNSEHASLDKLSPNEASLPENFEKIFNINVTKSKENKTVSDLVIGDKVRVRIGGVFTKGTEPKFSDDVFEVKSIKATTITLNDDKRKKRDNLLKVPNDTPLGSTNKNIIHAQKAVTRKEKAVRPLADAFNIPVVPQVGEPQVYEPRQPRIKKVTEMTQRVDRLLKRNNNN